MDLARARQFVGGRSDRREYWLSILGVFVLNLILSVVVRESIVTSLISAPFWLVIAARRLHDFNRSAVWALIPVALGFLTSLIGMVGGLGLLLVGAAFNGVVALAAVIVIGVMAGTPGPNRFGDPVRTGG